MKGQLEKRHRSNGLDFHCCVSVRPVYGCNVLASNAMHSESLQSKARTRRGMLARTMMFRLPRKNRNGQSHLHCSGFLSAHLWNTQVLTPLKYFIPSYVFFYDKAPYPEKNIKRKQNNIKRTQQQNNRPSWIWVFVFVQCTIAPRPVTEEDCESNGGWTRNEAVCCERCLSKTAAAVSHQQYKQLILILCQFMFHD